jgi:hypothetical protein
MSDQKKNLPAKALDPAAAVDPVAALAALVAEFGPGSVAKLDDVARAFKIAEGVVKVRQVVKAAIDRILPLAGSPLGFRTDRDAKGGYHPDVIADCATEALLRGVRLTGNEWNIIGSKYYCAQAGFARLVAELPGLTDLELAPGVPVAKDGGAIVDYAATWKFNGHPMSLSRKIPVKVNEGLGVDAILGKAKRKMLAAIYERVTGSVMPEGECDDVPLLPPAPPRAGQLAERAAARAPLAAPAAPPVAPVQLDEHGLPVFAADAPAAEASLFDNKKPRLPD